MENNVTLFEPELVFTGIEVEDKEKCIVKMVDLLDKRGVLEDKQVFLDTVMEREAIMSTGIGREIALPHGRSELVSTVRSVVFLLDKGIDFQAVDDEPVKLVVLTASPISESHVYMLMLKHLTNYLRQTSNRMNLFEEKDSNHLYKILRGIENEVNKELNNK